MTKPENSSIRPSKVGEQRRSQKTLPSGGPTLGIGPAWTDRLQRVGTRISMDGKERCIDNVFIERPWRSLKYECVYLHA